MIFHKICLYHVEISYYLSISIHQLDRAISLFVDCVGLFLDYVGLLLDFVRWIHLRDGLRLIDHLIFLCGCWIDK